MILNFAKLRQHSDALSSCDKAIVFNPDDAGAKQKAGNGTKNLTLPFLYVPTRAIVADGRDHGMESVLCSLLKNFIYHRTDENDTGFLGSKQG